MTCPQLSIIVPIYNAGRYLGRCLDSIVDQSLSDFELILVNDGSLDDSEQICLGYVERDSRVRIVNQTNQGVSAARNKGIDLASGAYVTFVDPDDSLREGALEAMIRTVTENDSDFARMSFATLDGERVGQIAENIIPGKYEGSSIRQVQYSAVVGDFGCYVWLLVVKKDYLDRIGARFPQAVTMMEDTWFYYDLLLSAANVAISNEVTYNYTVNTNGASLSMQGFVGKIDSILKVNEHVRGLYVNDGRAPSVDATHLTVVASMLMVRADRSGIRSIKKMLATVSGDERIASLYKVANLDSLSLYTKLAIWSVVHHKVTIVLLLKLVRKLNGK